MAKQLFVVAPDALDHTWKQVVHLVEKGMLTSDGELTIEQIRLLIVQGRMLLLISKDIREQKIKAALVTELITFPNYRCMNIVSLAGDSLGLDDEDIKQLKQICRRYGATKLQGWTHPAMTRFLQKKGFNKKYDVIRMDIEDTPI